MKNLTIIYKKGDFGSIANLKYILSAGAYLIRGDYALDATHTLNPEENALLIVSTRKIPDGENPTKGKIRHTLVICSQGVFLDNVKVRSVEDGEITEPKLDTRLKTKVNNNVKTVAQTLTGSEMDIALMNLKFKDNYQNFFTNRYSYESVAKLSVKPNYHIFGSSCTDNTFGTNCYYTTLGNNCRSNTFGNDCVHNILGDGCSYNIFGKSLECSKIDSGVTYIELRSNASVGRSLKNIHILSGIRGKSSTERLVINIPDEYLNSSRELIITTKRTDGGPSTPEDIVMYYADEVVDKQNKQDNTLATSSKEVVGAINELFNGGVKDTSIVGAKLADAAVTSTKIAPRAIIGDNIQNKTIRTEQIADNAITTENIKEYAVTSDKIKDESITGDKIPNETILERHLGYWAVTKNKIASGQVTLDKLASSVQDTLKMVGTNVKIINEDTDLNTLTENGIYLLCSNHSYTNYPNSDSTSSGVLYPNAASLLIVSYGHTETTLTQLLVSVSNSFFFPMIRCRSNYGNGWGNWNDDRMYPLYDEAHNSVKKQDLLELTDTEVNNIWDNN